MWAAVVVCDRTATIQSASSFVFLFRVIIINHQSSTIAYCHQILQHLSSLHIPPEPPTALGDRQAGGTVALALGRLVGDRRRATDDASDLYRTHPQAATTAYRVY